MCTFIIAFDVYSEKVEKICDLALCHVISRIFLFLLVRGISDEGTCATVPKLLTIFISKSSEKKNRHIAKVNFQLKPLWRANTNIDSILNKVTNI